MRRFPSFLALAAILVVLSAPLAGCGKGGPVVLAPKPDPLAAMPATSSPSGALRAFEWSCVQRSTEGYPRLFTTDYRFIFSPTDTAGRFRNVPFTRDDELISFDHIVAAATQITLALDKNFVVFPDPRPGMDARYHKNILTQVDLNVVFGDGSEVNIQGKANFFLVRGDSALVPDGVAGRDSTHWFVVRWEDQTLAGALLARLAPGASRTAGVAGTTPTHNKTWGSLKAMFR